MTKKPVKIKEVKAWAAIEDSGIQEFQFSFRNGMQYSIFPTKLDAQNWCGGDDRIKIKKVIIKPL